MTTTKQEGDNKGLRQITLGNGWWKKFCALCLLCAGAAIALPAQTFNTLADFNGTNGNLPYASLVQGSDGSLYGTTNRGGANGWGTVFKITPSGTLTTLYSFCSQSGCTDGANPIAGLIQAADGNFYGTTTGGGTSGSCPGGCGTVFKMTPNGTLTTLHSFDGTEGQGPYAALVHATDGNFYGTTVAGGANNSCTGGGCGTVFEITPSGTLTTLYSFCSRSGCSDGESPTAALIQASDGNFYGTTYGGGNNSCTSGCGTVFKITPSGTLTTLHSFDGTDGDYPYAALVQATNGNFYGTTQAGGANDGSTVFKITPSGTLTTLYSFCAQPGCTDGDDVFAGLVQATDGNFYGATAVGGADRNGTIFKITPGGALTTLHNFAYRDGSSPYATPIQDTNGAFYGTTAQGGVNGEGTVFSLETGLGPVVSLSPTSLTFGPQGVSAPNVPQVVTLTNTGGAALSITNIAVTGQNSGDFAQANNCPISPNTLAAGDNCMITAYFFPVGAGALAAAVTITDNAPGSPQNVPLSGVGVSGKPGLAAPRR
ncbi:MAG TPA: choice-of-anchor tandem repeat GloVer-containing protein [Terriglobia bacterium]|nr:choice-of-anchor tandem repeat GloVer-containing protein [Terriglobia bacterium]